MINNPRECLVCGANIDHRHTKAKTCSDRCRQRYKRWKRQQKGYDPRYRKESRAEYLERVHRQAADTRRRKADEAAARREARANRNLERQREAEQRRQQRINTRTETVTKAEAIGLSAFEYGQLRVRYRKYNLTPELYIKMRNEQGSICANPGCTAELIGFSGCVDHDHETGAIRGILCNPCNKALGITKDDPAILQGLIKYLAGV